LTTRRLAHKGRPGAEPSGLWDELPALMPVPFIAVKL